MVDANLNRAKEGLRVAEDAARFVLGDHHLASRCRAIRHDLQKHVQSWGVPIHAIIAERDIDADTETGATVRNATSRTGLGDLVGSSMSRAAEALRCIEDALRLIDPTGTHASHIEKLRFASYAVAKQLVLRFPAGSTRQHVLYVIITHALCTQHAWQDVLRASLDAGATAIQLREKQMMDLDRIGMSREAKEIIENTSPNAELWINDRPDIAAVVGATGVHLGQTDMSTADARRVLQPRQAVGRSASTVEQAVEAVNQGADMVGFGAMFDTSTKANPHVRGPELLREISLAIPLNEVPHVAIGGITPDNVGSVIVAGARGVAVSSIVCTANDPGAVCMQLLEKMNAACCS